MKTLADEIMDMGTPVPDKPRRPRRSLLKRRARGSSRAKGGRDLDQAAEPQVDENASGGPVASATHLATMGIAHKLLTAAHYVALVCLPLLVFTTSMLLARPAREIAPTIDPTLTTAQITSSSQAGEFGERAVRAWLAATSAAPGEALALFPGLTSGALPKTAAPSYDVATVSASAQQDAQGVWQVIVAATVGDGAEGALVRRRYQVPVEVSEAGQVQALAVPTPVAVQSIGGRGAVDYGSRVGLDNPLAQSVAGFVAAHAAGAGAVDRYTSPGTTIEPLTPPPYVSVSLVDIAARSEVPAKVSANGEQVRVFAHVTATRSDDSTTQLSYALTMRARDGRWEVAQIDPVPAVRLGGV